MVPAGGHQGYAALGGLYTQAAPLNRHIYGDIESQMMNQPVSSIVITQNVMFLIAYIHNLMFRRHQVINTMYHVTDCR